jgi:hypothetical protein
MKKKIIVICLLITMGSTGNLWAFNKSHVLLGLDAMGAGAILICIPYMFGTSDSDIYAYVGGGVIAGLGLILFIVGCAEDDPDSDSYAMLKENPILEHVSFGTSGEQTYIGVHFSY